jgi:hypothetical protein
VTWNCNGALRKKWRALAALQADVAIVQECEDPALTSDADYHHWAGRHLWAGKNKSKGIGIFVRPDIQLERADIDLAELELFLPCRINGLPLLAAWTQNVATHSLPYIGQLWRFLQSNRPFLIDPLAMVIGDLNSNAQWDRRTR